MAAVQGSVRPEPVEGPFFFRQGKEWASTSSARTEKGVRAWSSLSLLAALAACASQSAAAVAPGAPGFLLGLWHGFIFPVAWVISLFVREVSVYQVPNNGGWYDFGYFLGIAVFGIGARKTTRIVYRERVIRETIVPGSHRVIREEEQ